MKRIVVGLWWVHLLSACLPVFSQVDTSYVYNTSMPYGTLDIRIAKSPTRYYVLQEDVTFSFRESSPGVKTNTYKKMTSWNSEPYRQGNLRERIINNNGATDNFVMNYRFLMPLNYDPNYEPGYPIILMMHGLGERGNCWNNSCYWNTPGWNPLTNSPPAPTVSTHNLLNNDHNLLHSGLKHLDAMKLAAGKLPDDPTLNSKAFPGFVLFPQNLNGWGSARTVEDVIRILRLIIKKYNIDENRVYIHGLSNGGGAVYQAIKRAPWLFACALPMSAINNGGIITENLQWEVGKIPIWQFQGGKDINPTPSRTYGTIKKFRDAGADIRYSYYSHLGHGTWNTAYNEPDFFSWILSKRKYNPHVYYKNPVICLTTGAGVHLGFSKGFFAYQWELDGQIISDATSSDYTANEPGTYRGRFSRKPNPQESDWEPWSDPIVVTEINPSKPSIVPVSSTHLRGPGLASSDANNTVVLESSVDAELYQWYKNGTPIDFPVTDIDDTLKRATFMSPGIGANGAYTLKTLYSYCPSPSSDPINLFFNNSAPQNVTLTSTSVDFKGQIQESGVFLTWNDLSSNEVGYEIWRRKAGAGNQFVFAGRTGQDGISFFDSPLEPLTTYEYKLRAVSNTGASNYIPSNDLNVNYQITTPADEADPTAPQDLKMVHNDIHEITLSWLPAQDNTGIREYLIEYNGTVISTDSAVTTFTITGLPQNTSFPVSVKAVDYGGNVSPSSNTIIGTTYVLGLFYKHSTGGWEDLDDSTLVATWDNPEFTGFVPNITLTPRTQEDFFNFQFTGYLDIVYAGDYTFSVTSNDGGRLILDDSIVVDVDGTHGNVTKESNVMSMTAGPHKFRVDFFEYAAGQILTVKYKGPDSKDALINIPDSVFRSGHYNAPPVLPAPHNLAASPNGMKRIDITWQVDNGLEVELYRAESAEGPFSIITKTTSTTFADSSNLDPQKKYYYKARSISNTSLSAFSEIVSASTSNDAEPPSAPTALAVSNQSHTQATITWQASTDNVGVKYYEVYQNDVLRDTSKITAFTLTGLLPNTSYSVKVKAVDLSSNKSGFSDPLVFSTNAAAIFYSTATGNLNDVTTWKSNVDGSGSSPVSFEDNGQYFVISNRTATSMGGQWVVSGSASKVVVPDGVTFTADFPLAAKMEIEGNAVLHLNDSTAPDIQKISPASTIHFNVPAFIPARDYGHIVLSGDGIKTFEGDTIRITGNLTLSDSIILKGGAANSSKIILNGNFTSDKMGVPASDNRIDLEFTDNVNHTITTAQNLYFYKITVGSNSAVDVIHSGSRVMVRLGSLNGGGLVVKSGSTFTVGDSNMELIQAGAINSSGETGKISISGGDIKITSSSDVNSNLYFAPNSKADSLRLNLTGSGRAVIQSQLDVAGGIKIKAGQLNAGGNITLLSTADKTASIQEIENGGSIQGNVIAQHYLGSQGERWTALSSPVSGITIANWQQYFPVYGQFTGSSGAGDPSVLVSNGSGLVPYPSTGGSNTAPIERGKGYYTKLSNSSPIILTQVGAPFQGNVNFTLTGGSGGGTANGWNLIGNPYASPVKWNSDANAWSRSGVSNVISIPEKKMINGQPVNQFEYFDPLLGDVTIKQGSAFWVQATSQTPVLMITERAKTSFVNTQTQPVSHVIVTLKQGDKSDRAYILFTDEATDNFDNQYDGMKRMNEGIFSFSTMAGTTDLAVNNLSNSFCSKTVKLNLMNTPAGTYTISVSDPSTLNGVGSVKLTDSFAKTTTVMTSETSYQFNVTSDAASFGSGRFTLTFQKQSVDLATPQVTASDICSDTPATITVSKTQEGVAYAAVNSSGTVISEVVQGGSENIELVIPNDQLQMGTNHIRVQAAFEGCGSQMLTSEVDVDYIAPFSVTTEESVSVCVGESAMLQATGAPDDGYYRWYDENLNLIDSVTEAQLVTESVVNEKVYYVSAYHSGGCESEKKAIHVYADSLGVPTIVEANDTLFVQGEATQYQWKLNDEIIPGANKPFFKPFGSGLYTVVASTGGCVKESEAFNYAGSNNCQFNLAAPVASSDNSCGSDRIVVNLSNTQSGVKYTAMNDANTAVSQAWIGNGETISIELNSELLTAGVNHIRFQAGFDGCTGGMLATEISVNYTQGFSVVIEPEIKACAGENVLLTAKGAPQDGWYKWYDKDLNMIQGSMGTYVLYKISETTTLYVSAVHPNGCESSKKEVLVKLRNEDIVVENRNGMLHAAGETAGVYQWKLDGVAIPGAVDSIYAPVESGLYSVVFTKDNCTVESPELEYTITANAPALSNEFVLNTFPVPSRAVDFRISVQSPKQERVVIRILDSTGKSVYRNSFLPEEILTATPVNPENGPLKEGMYIVIATQGSLESRKRVVIRN